MTRSCAINTADVAFDGSRPYSRQFGDVYFAADGDGEVRRVFLGPARIVERGADPSGTLTVVEFGFGTGLNLLVTASAVRSRLHFVSFELHPLDKADLQCALAPWRPAYPLADALIAAWPPPIAGWHRLHLRSSEKGQVQLSLFFGDVLDGLRDFADQQRRGVDAWFLDGFAPGRNPHMWREPLFDLMTFLSAPAATATTFSAAGDVRRRLAAHGFHVRKVDQRPHKRHSTVGVFQGVGVAFSPPKRVAVMGAGLAGAATARALADKGLAVTVLDPTGIGTGVPAAVLHPRLSADLGPAGAWRMVAFLHAFAWLDGRPGVQSTGVLQRPTASAPVERLRRLASTVPDSVACMIDAETASKLAGRSMVESLLYPSAATVDVGMLIRGLVDHRGISLVGGDSAPMDMPAVWATGPNPGPFSDLEVAKLPGQMDRYAIDEPPTVPVVGHGVFVPVGGTAWVGATYEYNEWPPGRATRVNAEKYRHLVGVHPGPALERFRGNRAVTSDRLPVIGRHGASSTADTETEQAWLNLGHGSHGTCTAPFGAEIVASALNGEAAPATVKVLALLRPSRFAERQRRRPNPFLKRR